MSKLTVVDVLGMFSEVIDFNSKMGNSLKNKNLIDSYHKFTKEEFFGTDEYLDGVRTGNLEMILDGLCDLVHTTAYWALLNGYTPNVDVQDVFSEVDMNTVKTISSDLKYSIEQGLSYYSMNNLIMLLAHSETLRKFDIVGAFKEVARSNNSKVIPKEGVDIEEELLYITSEGRYADISVEEVVVNGEIFLAFKAGQDVREGVTFKAPKLIKTRQFSEPNLQQFIL
jgi:hypothetical protein